MDFPGNVEGCFLHEICSYRGGKHDLIDIIKDCTLQCVHFFKGSNACTFNVVSGLSKRLLTTLVV